MPETVPLFMEAWVTFLGAHSRAVGRVSEDLEAACGISLSWFDVLFQLSVAPQRRLRMQELARAVLLSKSGLTRLVDRMEEAGLLARMAIPGNRRSVRVQLAPAGRRLQRKARLVVRRSVEQHFAAQLRHDELATLRSALARVAPAMSSSLRSVADT